MCVCMSSVYVCVCNSPSPSLARSSSLSHAVLVCMYVQSFFYVSHKHCGKRTPTNDELVVASSLSPISARVQGEVAPRRLSSRQSVGRLVSLSVALPCNNSPVYFLCPKLCSPPLYTYVCMYLCVVEQLLFCQIRIYVHPCREKASELGRALSLSPYSKCRFFVYL